MFSSLNDAPVRRQGRDFETDGSSVASSHRSGSIRWELDQACGSAGQIDESARSESLRRLELLHELQLQYKPESWIVRVCSPEKVLIE